MNDDAAGIVIKGLTHSYGLDENHRVMALAGVDLVIDEGDFVVILGPNGSGKSTLAKHLNVLLLPDEGDVWVFGMNTKDPDFTWEIRKNAGMVFQNPDNQIIATVVEEDVAFGPENLGVDPKEIRERVTRALEAVDMLEFARHAPHYLSGGQKQRVAIAGILAMEPKCIILDEPTAMLDPRGREEVMQTITRLNQDMGITVIHITHYMDEALYADKVVVMNEGKIVMQGTPRDVFEEEELISDLGLDVPPIGKLSRMLASHGVPIDSNALSVDELVDELCQLK
ncbi:MAG TPA: energy-coupling factor transporter ATPase [Bacillota bacterium]|nr:energy-coupling factor transporter ATPase [Candidatus Fermentithermobacillaceae bacterium]HOB30408.1 energy-coupling factor transporter ATPase [Bacillota bacterium]HOK64343.1 energy-coupling factor transporter ATPase [Bacillota bacterium]HOL11944.1 energy-coupling factor transporter ATPase [Bacillota bacterium]HOQ03017.1 energy-coupling factor transporter ATPase [Bacillota bacterium]